MNIFDSLSNGGNTKSDSRKTHSRKSHPGKLTFENSLPKIHSRKLTPTKTNSRKSHPGKLTPENSLPKIHSRRFTPANTRSLRKLTEIPTARIQNLTINFFLNHKLSFIHVSFVRLKYIYICQKALFFPSHFST
jgi:hypothetical protein